MNGSSLTLASFLRWIMFVTAVLGCAGCKTANVSASQGEGRTQSAFVTHISLRPEVLHTGVKRFGINLSGQTFYDSGQMLRNLVFRNPGFEGETWQTILRCKAVTATTCTDKDQYSTWSPGFLDGAHYEVLSGLAKGATGQVLRSSAASNNAGVEITMANPSSMPNVGDVVLVRMHKPGNAQAGWWTTTTGGASFATEQKDLSPLTPGKQALRIEASKTGQHASVASFFDTTASRSFVQLRGTYTLGFRAKGLEGERMLGVKVERLATSRGNHTFLIRTIKLDPTWQDFTLSFSAEEYGSQIGPVDVTFTCAQSSALLDDVALMAPSARDNPTAFRNEVVQTLRELHPGVLRYMDNGTDFGSSLDNMLAVPFARMRAGWSTQQNVQEDVPIGLHEFLDLVKAIGAEPWYTMPAGTSPSEAAHLIEYLAGGPGTPYGARRVALGQRLPWTQVFPRIHLELGNEQWNEGSFPGATISEPVAFGARVQEVFAGARHAAGFDPARFDLVLGTWAAVPWWTSQELSASTNSDSVAIAPYLFSDFQDASSKEAIFGPMLAQPEQIDERPGGFVYEQAKAAAQGLHPSALAVYEVNLGTMNGSTSIAQGDLDTTVPSLGAGLAVADHMLLMLRDLGITTQCLFALPEFQNPFHAPGTKKTVPLWGSIVDMGGQFNRKRPVFLAEQLINRALLPVMLTTRTTGDPTWNQNLSSNDKVELADAHLLQSFAFRDGKYFSLILLNLSRDQDLPVHFEGPLEPRGEVEQSRLASGKITDSNEEKVIVSIRAQRLKSFDSSKSYVLPPFSLTVLKWQLPE